jgi:UDP-glucose 4-epimerase
VRVVVTGASGNVGTGLLRRLAARRPADTVLGLCRRPPPPGHHPYDGVEWRAVDVGAPAAVEVLTRAFADADAVVHLAWAVQPVRDERLLHRVNIAGSRAVLEAAHRAGVGRLVFASSVAVYAPRSDDAAVDEQWARTGIPGSRYGRHKVCVERMLDRFEAEHPDVAVTRPRAALVAHRAAARELARYFLGPLVPRALLRAARDRRLPLLPLPAGLQIQLVHADDVGDALVTILERRATGAFNLAAERLDTAALAGLVGARAVQVPPALARAALRALWSARATPLSPGWFRIVSTRPLMSSGRAARELGWTPRRTSQATARELVQGLAEDAAGASPALQDRRAASRGRS